MKKNWGTNFIKNLKSNGWVEHNGLILPQKKAQAIKISQSGLLASKKKNNRPEGLKTGWIDDNRNLKNKKKHWHPFILLVRQELGLEVWPEFYFSTERLFRIDYAIPVDQNGKELKIAIEQEGGIWMKGNSGHSSGVGIKRDMEKSNLLQSLGWKLIRVQPSEVLQFGMVRQLEDLLNLHRKNL